MTVRDLIKSVCPSIVCRCAPVSISQTRTVVSQEPVSNISVGFSPCILINATLVTGPWWPRYSRMVLPVYALSAGLRMTKRRREIKRTLRSTLLACHPLSAVKASLSLISRASTLLDKVIGLPIFSAALSLRSREAACFSWAVVWKRWPGSEVCMTEWVFWLIMGE